MLNDADRDEIEEATIDLLVNRLTISLEVETDRFYAFSRGGDVTIKATLAIGDRIIDVDTATISMPDG